MDMDSISQILKDGWGVAISAVVSTAVIAGMGLRRFGVKFFAPQVSQELRSIRDTMEGSFAVQQGHLEDIQSEQVSTTQKLALLENDNQWIREKMQDHGYRIGRLERGA